MLQTIEAMIDEQGNVRLLEPIQLSKPRRAFVMILTEERISPKLHCSVKLHLLKTGIVLRKTLHGHTYNRNSCLNNFLTCHKQN